MSYTNDFSFSWKEVSKYLSWCNHYFAYWKLWRAIIIAITVVIKHNKKNDKNNHENNTENRDHKNLKKSPWIPNSSPKIKREFKKIGEDFSFTSGKSLQQILCQKNKPKLLRK